MPTLETASLLLPTGQQGPGIKRLEWDLKSRFGNAPAVKQVAKPLASSAESSIRALGLAETISRHLHTLAGKKGFSWLFQDVRKLNMSIEDWASRFNLLLAVYLPQMYFSLKNNRHKWETNARNFIIWTTTILLTFGVKHPKYGINSLLDTFMKPKMTHAPAEGHFFSRQWDALTNRFRLHNNYLTDVLTPAGIKVPTDPKKIKGFWASMDNNLIDSVWAYIPKAQKELAGLQTKLALSEKELARKATLEKFLHTAPQFLKRLGGFQLLSTGVFMALMTYIVGGLMMELVIKYIAPFDHDFDMGDAKKLGNKAKGLVAQSTHPLMTTFSKPSVFATRFEQPQPQPQTTGGRG